jgi:hypothetical protein
MKYLKTFKLFERVESLKDSPLAGLTGAAGATGAGTTKAEPKTIPFEYKFDKGMWSAEKNPELENSLRKQIAPITDYLKKYINNTVTITVQAGESRVTNYDNEASKRTELKSGILSGRRGETVRTILRKILEEYKNRKLFTNDPKIDVNYIIGETPYKKNVDSPDKEEYKKEQFVKFVLKAEGEKPNKPGGRLIPEDRTCNKPEFTDSEGRFTGIKTEFLSKEYKFVYPDAEGKIVVRFNPVDVPDLFIYEYNGEKKSTGFLGMNHEYYRLALGTIIGNVYKDKEKPWYFKDIKYKEIDRSAARKILKDADKETVSDPYDFKPAFPDKELDPTNHGMFNKNKDIIPYILDNDQIKSFNSDKGWIEERPGYPKTIDEERIDFTVSIPKKENINDFLLRVSGPIGQTAWGIKFVC